MIDWLTSQFLNPTWWHGLLVAYLVCALWNWRAGLVYILALIACRVIVDAPWYQSDMAVGPIQVAAGQVAIFAVYTSIGAISLFLLDVVAGVFLCIVATLYGISLIDVISNSLKMKVAEVLLLLGVVCSAYMGPSGGIISFAGLGVHRSGNNVDFRPSHISQDVGSADISSS